MSTFYRISDFARLAGVTVRTLQYYDRIDLLKPATTTEGKHRLYRRNDLVRLQQILTLKWMGFKLDQIKTVLDSPTFDLKTALSLQKAAIDSQIASLQAASNALERVLALDAVDRNDLDNESLNQVIQAVIFPQQDWAKAAFTDEAWAGIATRSLQYSQADFEQFEQDWRTLTEQFEELRHLPPDSDPVQDLAATMYRYIKLFSAGDDDTEAGVRGVWQNREQIPQDYQMVDADLMRFMQQAYTIYQEQQGE